MGTLQKKLYHFYHMMAAFQERFAPAICAMTIGLIFVAYLFNYIENKTQADQQKDNLLLTLSEVKDQVELDMETGFYLTENPRAQKLLESTSTRKKSLLSIQILDRTGLVLFSTDRAAIGELSAYYVRQQIAAAVRSSNKSTTNLAAPWNSYFGNEILLGIPLRNGYGEIEGHLIANYARANVGTNYEDFSFIKNGFWIGLALCVLVVSGLFYTYWHRRQWIFDDAPVFDAEAQKAMQCLREALDTLDACSHTLNSSGYLSSH